MEEEYATKLIDDLEEALVEEVASLLQKKLRKNAKPQFTYRGADVHSFGDEGTGYIVLVKDSEILYFVKHRTVRHNGFKLGRQVLVWRKPFVYEAAGFASQIFFKVLLPKYSALIADQLQTKQGKQFWLFALGHAFDTGLYVYFLDRRSTPNQLLEMSDDSDISKYSSQLWGHSEGHKRTFAVISTKPLSLKKRT